MIDISALKLGSFLSHTDVEQSLCLDGQVALAIEHLAVERMSSQSEMPLLALTHQFFPQGRTLVEPF